MTSPSSPSFSTPQTGLGSLDDPEKSGPSPTPQHRLSSLTMVNAKSSGDPQDNTKIEDDNFVPKPETDHSGHGGDTNKSNPKDVVKGSEDATPGQRFRSDLLLLFLIVLLIAWPWTFFAVVQAKNGIQMYGRLADVYNQYPHQVAILVTQIGTVNRLAATFLLGKVVVRFGQELIASAASERVSVFGVSALLAFRHMSLVWGWGQFKQLARGKGRFAIMALLLLCLAALSMIPSGTAGLITPGEFNKTAVLKGTELDFSSQDSECIAWFQANRVQNNCDWRRFENTQFTTCLGENQMLDVLDSGRANMLSSVLNVGNETSSLNQLGAEGGIRFLGSVKGILPLGPNGVSVFKFLDTSNPFEDQHTRKGMVSYNYTLAQQGLESTVTCEYDTVSPIRYEALEDTSTLFISTAGFCDPAAGLEDVLENVVFYPTLNVNNTLTYWACKQRLQPGALDPTYFIYLRGKTNYAASIGNITCKVSPMRSQIFSVDYLSIPGYFVTKTDNNSTSQSSQRATFSRYIEHGLIGLGNLIWEGQNWSSNLVAEVVFSLAAKNMDLSTFERNPKYLELYAAMLQGVLEYEATYSRLVYSLGENKPQQCLRNITGLVSYSVRGWFIDDSFTQAGLLLPMTLINLASLSVLIACFVIGRLDYKYNFDATDNISLLTALVEGAKRGSNGEIEWGNKVKYTPVGSV